MNKKIRLSKLAYKEQHSIRDNIAGAYIDDTTNKLTIMSYYWWTEFDTTDTTDLTLAQKGERPHIMEKFKDFKKITKVEDLPKKFDKVDFVKIADDKYNRITLETILDCFDKKTLRIYVCDWSGMTEKVLCFEDDLNNKGFILPIRREK